MKKMVTVALALVLLTACLGRPTPPLADSNAAASVTSETVSPETAAELAISAVMTGKTVLTGTLFAGDTSDTALALAEDGLLSKSQTILGFDQDGKLSGHMGAFTYLDEAQAAAQHEAFLEEGTAAQLYGNVVTVQYSQSPFVDMTAEQAQAELTKNGYACQIEPIS